MNNYLVFDKHNFAFEIAEVRKKPIASFFYSIAILWIIKALQDILFPSNQRFEVF